MHSYWGTVAIRQEGFYREKQSSFLQLCLCRESNTIMTILVKPCLHCLGKFSLLIKQARLVRINESSAVVKTNPVALQIPPAGFNITAAGYPMPVYNFYIIDFHQMVAGRRNDSVVGRRHCNRCGFLALCALVSPPLHLQPRYGTDVPQLP